MGIWNATDRNKKDGGKTSARKNHSMQSNR
jgi:hypothetical protein